jgi:chemotaxis protein methyltransferase CheR
MSIASTLVRSQHRLSDDTFRQLRDHIYTLTGIYFQNNKKYLLEGRLGKRIQILNISSFENYLQYIRNGKGQFDELQFLFDAVTINETYFFRNEPQIDAFEKHLVPEIIQTRKYNGRSKIRIWSAASSSGEEAYTLAMIYLEKLKPRFPDIDIEVFGTDISQAVIDVAKRGVYKDYSIRNIPEYYLNKYFAVHDGKYHLRDNVKKLVRFEKQNLYDQSRMRLMRNFDIIYCCNVLIYFDLRSKIQVVSNLYNCLNQGGYLFIGYAESLHGISTAYKLINFPKTVAYKKE